MTSLYIDRRGVEAKLDGSAMAFYENEERVGTVPIAPIKRIFLRGDTTIHTKLLAKLGEQGIAVVVLSGRKGLPTMLMPPLHNDASRRISQYKLSTDMEFRVQFTRDLVRDKLKAQLAFIDELAGSASGKRLDLIRHRNYLAETVGKIDEGYTLGMLRGLEGQGANQYFQALAAVLPESLHFTGRTRRPPMDPYNSLISLGYTMLGSEATVQIYAAGLDPLIGFFHELHYGRHSLSCDLIEPLRPMIDRFAYRLFHDGILRPEHFSLTEQGCLMGKTARLAYYPEYEKIAGSLREALAERIGIVAAKLEDAGNMPFGEDESFEPEFCR